MAVEYADPYAYPGSAVLRNKLGLRTEDALRRFEYETSTTRALQLRDVPIAGAYDLAHLKAIHGFLFRDVYDWAGATRTVGLSKGTTSFTPVAQIEAHAGRIATALRQHQYFRDLDKPTLVERVAGHYAEWNKLHPFREGNGRATRELLGQLLAEAGYVLDQRRIETDPAAWNEAARRSTLGDLAAVRGIFAESVRPARALAFETLPQAEALRRHPELDIAYETLTAVRLSVQTDFPGNSMAQERFVEQARGELLRRLDTGRPLSRSFDRGQGQIPARMPVQER